MAQFNSLNLKLSNSQLNEFNSAIKNKTEVNLRILSNMIGNSDECMTYDCFLHDVLLSNRQVANLRKFFANNSSTDIKLWKTQLSKMIHSGGIFVGLLGQLLKAGLPIMKNAIIINENVIIIKENVINSLAKSVLIPLGLTAASSAADAGI